MRHIILLDNKISENEYKKWVVEDTEFWKKHLDITTIYEVIRTDYSDYPTYIDADKDIRPTHAYLQDHIALKPKMVTISGYQGELVTRTEQDALS